MTDYSSTTEFDIDYRLSENNAPRSCSACGEPATRYFYNGDGFSEFRCDDHLPEGIGHDE